MGPLRKRTGTPSQRALASGVNSLPKRVMGWSSPPAGAARPDPMISESGIIWPKSAALSTLGGASRGRIRGVRLEGRSGRLRRSSSISPMGVTAPMGSLAKLKPRERAPMSLPST